MKTTNKIDYSERVMDILRAQPLNPLLPLTVRVVPVRSIEAQEEAIPIKVKDE